MSDTPLEGPLSIMEAVEALPKPQVDNSETETEAAPEAEAQAEPVESTEEDPVEPEETESEEADPEPEEPEEPQHLTIDEYGDLTIPIIVDGQEQKVTLAEAAKGYQLQSDYTRKAQALAEERKAFEAAQATQAEELNRQQAQIAQLLASQTEPEPDWVRMAKEDPLGYVETKAEWDAKQAERQQILQAAQQRQAREMQQKRAEESQMLLQKAPEFQDPQYQSEFVRGVAEHFGFTPEEISSAMDHRVMLMARQALAAVKAKSSAKAKVVVKSPKVIKPGAAKGKSEIQAEQVAARSKKLAKPHSVDEHLRILFGE